MKEKVNQYEWVINYGSACDSDLPRSGDLGVRQGGTGCPSGLDQQPAASLSSGRSPDGSWDVLSSTQSLKADTDCYFLFEGCLFFPLDDFTLTLEKRVRGENSALQSSLSSLIFCPWSCSQACSIPCLFLTPPAVFFPFPSRPPQAGFLDFGFGSVRQQRWLVDAPSEPTQAGFRAVEMEEARLSRTSPAWPCRARGGCGRIQALLRTLSS